MKMTKGKNNEGQRFYKVELSFTGVHGDRKTASTTFYTIPDDTRDLIARQLMTMRHINRQWAEHDKAIDLLPPISEEPIT